MANLTFFAAHDDFVAIFELLFTKTDVRIFDMYSDFDQELREYKSVQELEAAYPIGVDRTGTASDAFLALWSPSVTSKPDFVRIDLKKAYNGHMFRWTLEGNGLVALDLGGVQGKSISKTDFSHNSEKRARAWGVDAGVDWADLLKLSNKIQYHIRHGLAVAKVSGRPILPQAMELVKQGCLLKEAANSPWHYEASEVMVKNNK